jgi:hypothetical protein
MMIFDRSKEQTLGNFKRKLKEADCHGRQTEPYSPLAECCRGLYPRTEAGCITENDENRITEGSMGPLY